MLNESIAQIASNLKETALSLARHDDATEEINALLSMAERLEEITDNEQLTLYGATHSQYGVFVEFRDGVCGYASVSLNPFNDCNKKGLARIIWHEKTYETLVRTDTFGKGWICWKMKPTDSERAAAKWDEAKD